MHNQILDLNNNDVTGIISIIKEGLPVAAFENLSSKIGVPEYKLVETVNIDLRTLSRRKKEGRFKPDESERVVRLVALYEKAIEVFGDAETTQEWFKSPVKGLGYKTPLEFADTEPGAKEVERILNRIEGGVFF